MSLNNTHHVVGVLYIEFVPTNKMGEETLIQGVGDEVVLFGGFMVLSVIFIIVVSVWQRSRAPATARQEDQEGSVQLQTESHAPQADQSSGVGVDGSASTGQSGGTDGLRHRPNVATAPDERQSDAPHDEGGRGSPQAGSGPAGSGEEEIRIRLIQAGGPGHAREVCVTPHATLGHLRR